MKVTFVGGACLLAFLMVGCDRGQGGAAATEPAEPKEAPKPVEVRLSKEAIEENHVEVGTVARRVLVPTFAAPARVAFNAEAMSHVGAPVAGRVAELKVRLGDTVKQGDELVVVESPDLGEAQSDYVQKRTAMRAAAAAVEPARIAYERGKTLHEQSQGLSLAEVQKREADLRAAQAVAQAAASAATGAKNKLALMNMPEAAIRELEDDGRLTPRYSIRTPIAGQVIQCDLTRGALVGPDKDLQLEVADVAKVWVLADVPEADYARLQKGAKVHVTASALPAETFDGSVTLVAPALDAGTRTVQTRVEVANPRGLLRPGMLARAEVEAPRDDAQAVPAVPAEAVMTIDEETVVFVPVEGDANKFKRRDVKVGPAVGGWSPVTEGVKEGEKVVVRGVFILKAQLAKPPAEE